MNELKSQNLLSYSLLAIIAALNAIHFTILSRDSENANLLSLHTLLFVGIASLIWEERKNLDLNSDIISSLIGSLLIGWILIRTLSPEGYHTSLSPLILGIGVCLLASGRNLLKKYKKVLLILSLPCFYPLISSFLKVMGITAWTARFSSFLLWASGFPVYRDGLFIIMPSGRVEVYGACSGVNNMLLMITITMLFFMLIPLKIQQQAVSIVVAAIIAFTLNCFRVAILTLMANAHQLESFKYWHGGNGSLIFSMLSVGLFGVFSWFAYVRTILEGEPEKD